MPAMLLKCSELEGVLCDKSPEADGCCRCSDHMICICDSSTALAIVDTVRRGLVERGLEGFEYSVFYREPKCLAKTSSTERLQKKINCIENLVRLFDCQAQDLRYICCNYGTTAERFQAYLRGIILNYEEHETCWTLGIW